MTCLKWRPYHEEQKIIGVGNALGHFTYFEFPSMKNLLTIYESKNQILCCYFDGDGKQFATGGQDSQIRFYDESKHEYMGRYETQEGSPLKSRHKLFKSFKQNLQCQVCGQEHIGIWRLGQDHSRLGLTPEENGCIDLWT